MKSTILIPLLLVLAAVASQGQSFYKDPALHIGYGGLQTKHGNQWKSPLVRHETRMKILPNSLDQVRQSRRRGSERSSD